MQYSLGMGGGYSRYSIKERAGEEDVADYRGAGEEDVALLGGYERGRGQ